MNGCTPLRFRELREDDATLHGHAALVALLPSR
jgi:hypothetical protein